MESKLKREGDVERFNPAKVYTREGFSFCYIPKMANTKENFSKFISTLGDEKIDLLAATSLLQLKMTEVRKNYAANKVNWPSYAELNVINRQDAEFIIKLEARGLKELPDEEPDLCAKVFLNLINKLYKDIAITYVVVLIDDLLSEDKSRVKMFRNPSLGNVWQHFLKLLYHENEFVQYVSARIIAKLACWHPQLMEENDLDTYLTWLRDELRKIDNEYIQSVVRCLQMMLRVDQYRFTFLSLDGLPTLLSILTSKVNFQIQYQLIFCLWVMTFNPLLAEKMTHYNVISILADILKESVREKVSRIVLAVYRNMIEKIQNHQLIKEICLAMVQYKVLKQLYVLDHRSSDDEDFMNDVAFLNERLQVSKQVLSSFDKYATEVKSGRLEWSPVHKSAKFWRENAERLNEHDQELLRGLMAVMETSTDPVVLAVACYDVGEYVRYYPRGKNVVEKLGFKDSVLYLLSHEDSNVRHEALIALQKIMVPNWEYLGKQSESEILDNSTTEPK